jgi:hypothetical protein
MSLKPFTTPSINDYLARADSEKAIRLQKQWNNIHDNGAAECSGCGWHRGVSLLFRCLYCGEWFCGSCAEIHFGQTINEWVKKKSRNSNTILCL